MWRIFPALFVVVVAGHAAGQRPVKLDIRTDVHTIAAGGQLPIEVRLLNGTNQLSPAPKQLTVALQARLPSGAVKPLQTVTFHAGESTTSLTVVPPGTGMVYVWARHGELLPGGTFVAVRSAAAPRATVLPQTMPASGRTPAFAPAPPPVPAAAVKIALRYSPDRHFLADGKDAATVQAFLENDYPGDVRLNLFDSSGTMQPLPLTIPKGQYSGRAVLTFNQPGAVRVELLGSDPAVLVDGDRTLSIPFSPPITHATLDTSSSISLVDQADLVLTLRDDQQRPVATDVARHVTFALDNGRGQLTQKDADIAAGQFEARTAFQPAWFGTAQISAATPNLLTATAPVQVFVPLGLGICCIAGGLTGGWLAYWKNRRSGKRQLAIGLVTGFLFYWASLFLGLATLGHALVVNPFSAFALSTLGGWLQYGVFKMLQSRVAPAS